jgi:DNA (cytosine-5)-methyltransferase 1
MAYALARDPSVYTPWDANNPLHGTITGDGGVGNYHPSGRRNFSYQEKSQLQGFPARHKYFYSNKTSLGKQIGNAVPPIFAKALFEVIIPCLEEMDEKMRPWKLSEARKAVAEAAALEKRNAVAARNPIVLD